MNKDIYISNNSQFFTQLLRTAGLNYNISGEVNKNILGEKQLLSIYRDILTYYPDKADEFVKMVNNIRRITPYAFLLNLKKFIQNDLNSDFDDNYTNESYECIYGYPNTIIASRLTFKEDWEIASEIESNNSIKEEFNKGVQRIRKQD